MLLIETIQHVTPVIPRVTSIN